MLQSYSSQLQEIVVGVGFIGLAGYWLRVDNAIISTDGYGTITVQTPESRFLAKEGDCAYWLRKVTED